MEERQYNFINIKEERNDDASKPMDADGNNKETMEFAKVKIKTEPDPEGESNYDYQLSSIVEVQIQGASDVQSDPLSAEKKNYDVFIKIEPELETDEVTEQNSTAVPAPGTSVNRRKRKPRKITRQTDEAADVKTEESVTPKKTDIEENVTNNVEEASVTKKKNSAKPGFGEFAYSSLSCSLCDYDATNIDDLSKHISDSHPFEKLYPCSYCPYKSRHKHVLDRHVRMHTGEKPFACKHCGFRFASSCHLKTHVRTHTGEKPYACTRCDYRCAHKNNLIMHMRRHTGEKPFSCTICDYKCIAKRDLERHLFTHSGEKPFACTFCDYRSSQKCDLLIHVRTHTGEKPYACDHCNYKCARKTELGNHLRTHKGEKPFACPDCDYKCTFKSNLRIHVLKHQNA